MRDNRCKGMTILDFLRILRQEGGADRESECNARLPEDLRDALRYGAIIRGGWYSLAWYRAVHAAAQSAGMGPSFPRTVGRITTRNDLSGGVYAVFMKVVSPAFVISGSARLFNRYYEFGSMKVVESRTGFVQLRCTDCVGFDHHIWQDILGGCEGALQAAGARNVRARLLDGGNDGEEHAAFEATYIE